MLPMCRPIESVFRSFPILSGNSETNGRALFLSIAAQVSASRLCLQLTSTFATIESSQFDCGFIIYVVQLDIPSRVIPSLNCCTIAILSLTFEGFCKHAPCDRFPNWRQGALPVDSVIRRMFHCDGFSNWDKATDLLTQTSKDRWFKLVGTVKDMNKRLKPPNL